MDKKRLSALLKEQRECIMNIKFNIKYTSDFDPRDKNMVENAIMRNLEQIAKINQDINWILINKK